MARLLIFIKYLSLRDLRLRRYYLRRVKLKFNRLFGFPKYSQLETVSLFRVIMEDLPRMKVTFPPELREWETLYKVLSKFSTTIVNSATLCKHL